MSATLEVPTPLPYTTPCPIRGNFPGEYAGSLRWSCSLFEGHEGDCTPRVVEQRLYNHRAAAWKRWGIPEEVHLNGEMLRQIVSIAVSEASDGDGLDRGIMWLRINRYIAFANFLRTVCP